MMGTKTGQNSEQGHTMCANALRLPHNEPPLLDKARESILYGLLQLKTLHNDALIPCRQTINLAK